MEYHAHYARAFQNAPAHNLNFYKTKNKKEKGISLSVNISGLMLRLSLFHALVTARSNYRSLGFSQVRNSPVGIEFSSAVRVRAQRLPGGEGGGVRRAEGKFNRTETTLQEPPAGHEGEPAAAEPSRDDLSDPSGGGDASGPPGWLYQLDGPWRGRGHGVHHPAAVHAG
eukprot:3232926-Pyramimonas_sp.AAC.1